MTTITEDTKLYCWDCGHIETRKTVSWGYNGYEDDWMPYCSKCGHRTYLDKPEVE